MAVVHDLIVPAIGMGSPARQFEQRGPAQEQRKAVVVEAHAQAMPDQARGHGVEHLAQGEAARAGDAYDRLLVVAAPVSGQHLQRGPLTVDPPGVAGIAASDEFVEEAAVGGQIRELGARPQQQRVGDGAFEMAVRSLDAPFSWAIPALLRVGVMP